ncbi:MFS transporter [Candidatus Bathyarchaeota archaeon]|nr:MAG: MFS transporter [Candidatus Bathyarchaeota archaeon]
MKEQERQKSLVFFALGASMATGGPPMVALSLLMIDIADSLNVPVAQLGQISSFSSFLSIIMAILMGVLAVRYSHKLLLSTGLALILVSIIGTSLSSSYTSILVLYSLLGIGYSMVSPMVTTYIGQLYPPEGRTGVMGRLISVRSVVSFLAPLITGYLLARSNWRIAYSSFNLFLTAISLILVFIAIPRDNAGQTGDSNQLAGILAVLRNRSALAFLFAGAMAITPFMAIQVFNGSFLRQSFGLSVETVSQLMPLTAISVTVGLLFSNRLVKKIGLKRTVYLSTFVSAIAYLVYFGAGLGLTPSVLFSLIGAMLTGVWLASSGALGLFQEKVYRGSMMSLSAAAQSFGGVLGALVGGFALNAYGYMGLGLVASILGIIAFGVYVFLVKNE